MKRLILKATVIRTVQDDYILDATDMSPQEISNTMEDVWLADDRWIWCDNEEVDSEMSCKLVIEERPFL